MDKVLFITTLFIQNYNFIILPLLRDLYLILKELIHFLNSISETYLRKYKQLLNSFT